MKKELKKLNLKELENNKLKNFYGGQQDFNSSGGIVNEETIIVFGTDTYKAQYDDNAQLYEECCEKIWDSLPRMPKL
ncbi:MAG: hypothetical protein LBV69_10030 [Bacteroidales bacterium]|jgi:hypothetical protein|nr:hypothetical protein [Bacteroidales bacterium]